MQYLKGLTPENNHKACSHLNLILSLRQPESFKHFLRDKFYYKHLFSNRTTNLIKK